MQNWTISKVWRRSRPLALLMVALLLLVIAMLPLTIVVGHPLPYQGVAEAAAVGAIFGIAIAAEVYERR